MINCCEFMTNQLNYQCETHGNEFDCPDKLISYNEQFDEYGLIIYDGGSSVIQIHHCPWCGTKLPESKCDRWFDELEKLGYENPFQQDIPSKYKTSEWYRA